MSSAVKISLMVMVLVGTQFCQAQNPFDNRVVLTSSDKLIEYQYPDYPVTTASSEQSVLDGVYIDPEPEDYAMLENGEIKVYDQNGQAMLTLQYEDSVLVYHGKWDEGLLIYEKKLFTDMGTWVTTFFEPPGKKQAEVIVFGTDDIYHEWAPNGCMIKSCLTRDNERKCSYWEDSGKFLHYSVEELQGDEVLSISRYDVRRELIVD